MISKGGQDQRISKLLLLVEGRMVPQLTDTVVQKKARVLEEKLHGSLMVSPGGTLAHRRDGVLWVLLRDH